MPRAPFTIFQVGPTDHAILTLSSIRLYETTKVPSAFVPSLHIGADPVACSRCPRPPVTGPTPRDNARDIFRPQSTRGPTANSETKTIGVVPFLTCDFLVKMNPGECKVTVTGFELNGTKMYYGQLNRFWKVSFLPNPRRRTVISPKVTRSGEEK